MKYVILFTRKTSRKSHRKCKASHKISVKSSRYEFQEQFLNYFLQQLTTAFAFLSLAKCSFVTSENITVGPIKCDGC